MVRKKQVHPRRVPAVYREPERLHRESFSVWGELPAALHALRIVGDATVDPDQVLCSDGFYRPLRDVLQLPSVLLITRDYEEKP